MPWRQNLFPELLRLAWPIGVSMLSYSLMTVVDTLFVGRLGGAALAGVSMGGVAFFTLLCFGFGLLRSVKVVVSQAVGRGETDTTHFLGAGLVVALGLGVVQAALGFPAGAGLAHLAATDASGAAASSYLAVRSLGAPLALAAIALREARYGLGDSQLPMRATIAANLVNVGLDYLFIFPLGMGVAGAAWASVAAVAAEAAWLALAQREHGFGLNRRGLAELAGLWRLGWPLGLQMTLEVSTFAVLTAIFASLGDADVAAHQIAIQVVHLSFLPALALGEAASVLAGQAVGAGQHRLVTGIARRALLAAVIYTGICGVLFAVFATPIAGAFTGEARVIDKAVQILFVAAAFQIFDGANIVARCVLRGTGDVRVPATISVGIAWLCTPPLALALGYGLGMGVLGGWLGLCLEIVVAAVVLWYRLERRHWVVAVRAARRPNGGVALA
ncbi:MAG: MATE family efflux transporter [Myxococcales bacterium]|nr:MATE family efflux transporter [Myxococcales bacterium]